jgi:hypothetical protein
VRVSVYKEPSLVTEGGVQPFLVSPPCLGLMVDPLVLKLVCRCTCAHVSRHTRRGVGDYIT